jgi:hypothetical protein
MVPCVPRPIIRLNAVTMGVARQKAIKAVKRQMQAAGLKTSHVEMRIITAAANAYLQDHRDELLEEAAEMIVRVPGLLKLYEQEERRRTVQKCQVMHSRRNTDR